MSIDNSALSDKKGTDGGIERPDEPLIDLPDVFIEKFDADIEKARRSPSTTPDEERPECPECGSIRIVRKVRSIHAAQRRSEDYRCEGCAEHFSEPASYGEGGGEDEQDDEQADRDRPELEPGQSDFADFGGGV